MTRDGAGQHAFFDDDMDAFRAALGADLPVAAAVEALSHCRGDTQRAIEWLLEKAHVGITAPVTASGAAKEELGHGGPVPPLPPPVKDEAADEDAVKVKSGPIDAYPVKLEMKVKTEPIDAFPVQSKVEFKGPIHSFRYKPEVKVKTEPIDAYSVKLEEENVKTEPIEADGLFQEHIGRQVKQEEEVCKTEFKEEDSSEDEVEVFEPPPRSKKMRRAYDDDDGVAFVDLTTSHPAPYINPRPIRAMPPPEAMPVSVNEWRMVVAAPPAELEEYPPDRREWCFFKKSYVSGLSTCRGRKLLDAGEVVHFAFSSYDRFHGGIRVSATQAAALAEIVRFSTNRSGEIGKLSPVWAKCLAPLVNSSTIMIQGKMVFPMMELRLMQEILLYVSFYIHRSSMYLIAPENANHPDNPLRGLFKLLRRFGAS